MKITIERRPVGDTTHLPENLHPVLQRAYAARGVNTADELALSLGALLSPESMTGLDEAADLLFRHVVSGSHIVVIGDFDADGATSTAVAVQGLRSLGASNVSFLVPNRFEYGYGLTTEIAELALRNEPGLIITVDNGISSHEGVSLVRKTGVDVLITDHHLPGTVLPDANAIANPNLPGNGFESKSLAGVGVIFYVLLALRKLMRERGRFSETGRAEPILGELLGYVALGTVADVVTLDFNNRILVDQGLRRIRAGECSAGLKALIEIAGRSRESLTSTDLAFGIAPRLNAAGRMEDMTLGIECLLSDDPVKGAELARRLDQLNHERREVEDGMRREADAMLEKVRLNIDAGLPAAVVLHEPDWHVGVVGLLASRIKEATDRPVVVFALQDEDNLKGSARSIPGFHIRDAFDLLASSRPDLLQKFGGHAMAAGLSIRRDQLHDFTQEFTRIAENQIGNGNRGKVYLSDGELEAEHLHLDLADLLRFAGPWGQGLPEPLFDNYFKVTEWRIVGSKHLKMTLRLAGGKHAIAAIAFNVEKPGDPGPSIRALYRLGVNEYRGRREAQLTIEYFEPIDD